MRRHIEGLGIDDELTATVPAWSCRSMRTFVEFHRGNIGWKYRTGSMVD